MLAIEVTNIRTGVWERRDGRWCESRAWRFLDVNELVSCNVYAQPHTVFDCSGDRSTGDHSNRSWTNVWQGRDSCSGLTQLVKSWESLACQQLCSESPVGRWWNPCSYRLGAEWQRSCLQEALQCSAGVGWVVSLRQHFCCRDLNSSVAWFQNALLSNFTKMLAKSS